MLYFSNLNRYRPAVCLNCRYVFSTAPSLVPGTSSVIFWPQHITGTSAVAHIRDDIPTMLTDIKFNSIFVTS